MKNIYAFLIISLTVSVSYAQPKKETFHFNGNRQEYGSYEKGKEDGEWVRWNEDGQVISKTEYDAGTKLYREIYSIEGELKWKIDYQYLEGVAQIKTFENGVCISEHFSHISDNNTNLDYDREWENTGTRISRDENGISSYHLNDEVDLALGYYIQLPHYEFNSNGEITFIQLGANSVRWNAHGKLLSFSGYMDMDSKPIDYTWNTKGERIDDSGAVIPNDTVKFNKSNSKKLHKGKFKNNLPDGVWENYFPNEKLWYRYEFENGYPDGVFESFHINGNKHMQAVLEKGVLNGEYKEWFFDGKLKMEGKLEYGKKIGDWKFWNENGILVKEENLINGQLHGEYKKYHPDKGYITIKSNYDMGALDGDFYYWFNEDSLLSHSYYVNGSREKEIRYYANGNLYSVNPVNVSSSREYHFNGNLKEIYGHFFNVEWFENGNVKRIKYTIDAYKPYSDLYISNIGNEQTIVFTYKGESRIGKDAVPEQYSFMLDTLMMVKEDHPFKIDRKINGTNTIYYTEGKPWIEENYIDGKLNGISREWSVEGKLRARITYLNDRRDGEFKRWGNEGNLLIEGLYTNDLENGTWKWYYPNSKQIETKIDYVEGVLHGEYISYDEDGEITKHERYEDGLKHGICYRYDEDIKVLRSKTNYIKDLKQGEHKEFYNNGMVIWHGNFEEDKKHGTWINYDSTGNEINRTKFEYGIEIMEKGDLQCSCTNSYSSISSLEDISELHFNVSYKKVVKEMKDHISVDSNMYNSLFSAKYHVGSISSHFDLIAFKPIKLQLNNFKNVELILNPFLKGNRYSNESVFVRERFKDIKSDIDFEEFTPIDSVYFNILLELVDGWSSSYILNNTLKLYRYKYDNGDSKNVNYLLDDMLSYSYISKKPTENGYQFLEDYLENGNKKKFFHLIKNIFFEGEKEAETEVSIDNWSSRFILNFALELYQDKYDNEDSKNINLLLDDMLSDSLIARKPTENVYQFLEDYLENEARDKYFKMVQKTFFSEGEIVKGTEKYMLAEKMLSHFFGSFLFTSIDEINNFLKPEYKVRVRAKSLAFGFDPQLLNQWDTEKQKPHYRDDKLIGTNAIFFTDEINYKTNKGILFSELGGICFPISQIGNTAILMHVDQFEYELVNTMKNNVLKNEEVISRDPLALYVKNGRGEVVMENEIKYFDFKDVLIDGNRMSGKIVFRTKDEKLVLLLKNKLNIVVENISRKETILHFEYHL